MLFVLASLAPFRSAQAQPEGANYDEARVPNYVLPDPLVTFDGAPVTTPEEWWELRRPEVYRVFEEEVYGRSPERPEDLRFEVLNVDHVLGGTAVRKQIRIHFAEGADAPAMDLLMYVPVEREGPAPLFLGLNFDGNHTIHDDPGILLPRPFVGPAGDLVTASDDERGASASRWPVEELIARGYGLATAFYGDIDPDFDDGFQNGVHPLFYHPGQDKPAPDEWGSIAAWAWGLSRAMDYLETDEDIEEERIALMGHSRLGKAALWAGATDPRFYFVISNNSGEGGAAITRRRFGETIEAINSRFPHWFADNFNAYNGREDDLPVDMHLLLALVAPRNLYVASASEDLWADPRGEFLSALNADPVYRLLTGDGLEATEMPPIESPILSRIAYHIREGRHDVTSYDWQRWMDWMDLHH